MCYEDRNTVSIKRTREADDIADGCSKRQRQCKNTKSPRCIRFAPEPSTRDFFRNDDFCKSDLWYSREDFTIFQLERLINVQCYQRVTAGDKTPLDPDLVCFRGLEPYRSEKRRQKFLLARQTHVATILHEQWFQRKKLLKDTERYREVVEEMSRRSLQLARLQAICDEREVYPDTIVHIMLDDVPATDCTYSVDKLIEKLTPGAPCPLEQESPQQIGGRAA